jgi:anionic cell wall polymer biosynthesis LytR-Cps2A-Psr (LCP) family protein
MDGETALKFVRSRYADGEEGTDLARSARQQRVISAIGKKIMTPEVFLSPAKIGGLIAAIHSTVKTDIGNDTAAIMARWGLNAKNNLKNYVLPESLLINPPITSTYDSQYVFVPRAKNWSEVQEFIKSILP